jgi:threonine dehydratase
VRIATPVTIADGAQTPMVGEITFEIIRRLVDAVHTVTEAQMMLIGHPGDTHAWRLVSK